MGRISGKVAIVTGAAGGMGRAHALALAREGAKVMVTDLNEKGLRQTADEVAAAGGSAIVQCHDVAHASDWQVVVGATVAAYGKIDVLVNNAGIGLVASLEQTTDEQWDNIFAVNCKSAFLGCRAVLPEMKKTGNASIINVSSNFALIGRAMFTAYSASKGAVRSFSKALAAETAADGIRVNSLHPGLVATDLTKHVIETPEMLERILGPALQRRAADPSEISGAVVYLASDESSFMTGTELIIDGGYTTA
jgi:cyclopentanol dehydrogenase